MFLLGVLVGRYVISPRSGDPQVVVWVVATVSVIIVSRSSSSTVATVQPLQRRACTTPRVMDNEIGIEFAHRE